MKNLKRILSPKKYEHPMVTTGRGTQALLSKVFIASAIRNRTPEVLVQDMSEEEFEKFLKTLIPNKENDENKAQ